MTKEYFEGDDDSDLWLSCGQDDTSYHAQITQSKKNKGTVFIVTSYGSKKFKQKIINALKRFDKEVSNSIEVNDIHGGNVLEPDYNKEETNDPNKEYIN